MENLDIFTPHRRKTTATVNLNPILDILITVIFFLLLGASFKTYTQVVLPPSQNVTVNTIANPVPLSPKLLYINVDNLPHLILTWGGAKPGFEVTKMEKNPDSKTLSRAISSLIGTFKKNNYSEDSIQVGFGRDKQYQSVIDVMDGLKGIKMNVSLISADEAETYGASLTKQVGQ